MNELKKQIGAVVALLEKYNLKGEGVLNIKIGLESDQLNGDELLTCTIMVTGIGFYATGDSFKTAMQRLEFRIIERQKRPDNDHDTALE